MGSDVGHTAGCTGSWVLAAEEPAPAPTWHQPKAEAVRAEVLAWLESRKIDEQLRAKADELWAALPQQPTGGELLDCLASTLALGDPNAKKLVELCSTSHAPGVVPGHDWLVAPDTPPLVAKNLRLLFGRWCVHQALFDEAGAQLSGVRPEEVVDPASLLFYQGVVHHRLLDRDAGIEAIDRLLEGEQQSPKRYVAVARLMKEDISGLREDTLDHIARRMDDIRRRLDLGRAGKRVRKVEDGVIESLDKLIKKLEDQQQQGGGGAGGGSQSKSPMQDSQIAGGRGPGNVDRRNIGSDSGWGDLPPKKREEALQQIGRDFPSHYRDVIEQYFRKLANEGKE